MQAMILAAGYGKRLRPLTNHVPKALMLIDEHTLIEKHLFKLRDAGVKKVVINTHWLGEKIINFLQDGSNYEVQITYSKESVLLNSGGGIKKALKYFDQQPFLVINSDIYCDSNYEIFGDFSLSEDKLAHVFLVANPAHNLAGDFSIKNDILCLEKTHTFSGISVLSPKLFDCESRSIFALGDLLRSVCQKGLISASLLKGNWFDVGAIERLEAVRKQLSKNSAI